MTEDTFDPFDAATNPPERTFDLFGKVEISAWACALDHGKVAYDPTNPNHKRLTEVDIFIQALPEITVKYPKQWEGHYIAEFPTWASVVLPSIKSAGYANVREINNLYARVALVPSKDKPFPRKDAAGNPTTEMITPKCMKFVQFFATEDECRAAAIAAHAFDPDKANVPQPVPATDPTDAQKNTALQFLKVIVQNGSTGKKLEDARRAVSDLLTTQYHDTVGKYFTVDSPETVALMAQYIVA